MSYLLQAHKWAKAHTKSFSPIRATPALLAIAAQYFLFCLNTLSNILVTTVTIIGSYILLYALEYFYKLLFVAPAQITAGMQSQIDSLSVKNKALKTCPEGPEILLEYTDRPIVRGQLTSNFFLRSVARFSVAHHKRNQAIRCNGDTLDAV